MASAKLEQVTETADQYFHITLGPVQGFVSQARRTRDFWAGSFLLSWLAAVAIKSSRKRVRYFAHADYRHGQTQLVVLLD